MPRPTPPTPPAFREAGLDPTGSGRTEAASWLATRSGTSAADHRGPGRLGLSACTTPAGAAAAGSGCSRRRVADPDPWRNRLRDAIGQGPGVLSPARPPGPGRAVARCPLQRGSCGQWAPESWTTGPGWWRCRAAQRRHPGDFWLNHELGLVLATDTGPEGPRGGPLTHRRLALRPRAPERPPAPGNADERSRRPDEAAAAYREAIRLKPGWGNAHLMLGRTLADQGKLDEAVAEYLARRSGSPPRRESDRGG